MSFNFKKVASTTAQVALGLALVAAAAGIGGKLGQIVFKKED
jgi:hypothetical protein